VLEVYVADEQERARAAAPIQELAEQARRPVVDVATTPKPDQAR